MKKTITARRKRVWFAKYGKVASGNVSPAGEFANITKECTRRRLRLVQSFDSWNDNEGGVALALTRKGETVVIGGKPFVRPVTITESLQFMADMCHEANGGEDGGNKAVYFKMVAAQLEGRTR